MTKVSAKHRLTDHLVMVTTLEVSTYSKNANSSKYAMGCELPLFNGAPVNICIFVVLALKERLFLFLCQKGDWLFLPL